MASIKDIIKIVKDKPHLYLNFKSIRCFKSFIMGWYTRNPDDVEDFYLLQEDFMNWILVKYKMDRTAYNSWDRTIEFVSVNEYDALDNFFDFFDEFLREKKADNINL